MRRLIRKPIIDKNGKKTTVRVRPDSSLSSRQIPSISRIDMSPSAIAERKVRQEAQATEIRQAKHKNLLADFEVNLKPRQNKDGSLTVSVFRAGVPNPPAQRGVEADSYTACDDVKPSDGRTGRTEAIFAAPSLGGVARWVNDILGYPSGDTQVRELRINADRTYVYNIRDWEAASSNYPSDDADVGFRNFWANGMTFREWIDTAQTDDTFNPEEWELLVPLEGVEVVKPVSIDRVAANVYDTSNRGSDEIASILKKQKKVLAFG